MKQALLLIAMGFMLSCSPTKYISQSSWDKSYRDTLQYAFLPSKKESQRFLLFLSDYPEKESIWKKSFTERLNRKEKWHLIKPNKVASHNFFRMQSLDTKNERVEDLIRFLHKLEQNEVITAQSEFVLVAEGLEGEVAVTLSAYFDFEKIVLIDVSALSFPKEMALSLDHAGKKENKAFYASYRVDTSLSSKSFLNELRQDPPNQSYFGNKPNTFWMSYLKDDVNPHLHYAKGDMYWIYTQRNPIPHEAFFDVVKASASVNPELRVTKAIYEKGEGKNEISLDEFVYQLLTD